MKKLVNETDVTYIKIVVGFGNNKLGNSRIYRKGVGKTLKDALKDLFRVRGNNAFPDEERKAVEKEFNEK